MELDVRVKDLEAILGEIKVVVADERPWECMITKVQHRMANKDDISSAIADALACIMARNDGQEAKTDDRLWKIEQELMQRTESGEQRAGRPPATGGKSGSACIGGAVSQPNSHDAFREIAIRRMDLCDVAIEELAGAQQALKVACNHQRDKIYSAIANLEKKVSEEATSMEKIMFMVDEAATTHSGEKLDFCCCPLSN
jgi:hypothetical protein